MLAVYAINTVLLLGRKHIKHGFKAAVYLMGQLFGIAFNLLNLFFTVCYIRLNGLFELAPVIVALVALDYLYLVFNASYCRVVISYLLRSRFKVCPFKFLDISGATNSPVYVIRYVAYGRTSPTYYGRNDSVSPWHGYNAVRSRHLNRIYIVNKRGYIVLRTA